MRQLCGFLGGINGGHRDKNKVVLRRQVETVELRVRMDCQRCEREVKKVLYGMKGWCSPCPPLWPNALQIVFLEHQHCV
jgi:hypothetical protein